VFSRHSDQCQQPQCLEIARVASQDVAIDRLGLFEASPAMMLRRLCDLLACRIGAQERLNHFFSLVSAARLRQRMYQSQLRGLKFRIEFECLAQPFDGFVEAALQEQAAAEFFLAFGVVRLLFERAAQQGLRFLAATLAIQRRTQKRHQVGLAGEIGERATTELLGHHAVAGAQECERAIERSACGIHAGDDNPGARFPDCSVVALALFAILADLLQPFLHVAE
jgi:hypothetical protein